MKVFALVALFASVALAAPAATPEEAVAALQGRAVPNDCPYMNCNSICCKNAGCNGYLHCDGSKCVYNTKTGSSWSCNCRYN